MDRETDTDLTSQSEEAVEVLREVWSAKGQSRADLQDAFGPQKSCKNMQNVGFGDLTGREGDLRAAWRATLEREGKLGTGSGSLADLVLREAKSSGQ